MTGRMTIQFDNLENFKNYKLKKEWNQSRVRKEEKCKKEHRMRKDRLGVKNQQKDENHYLLIIINYYKIIKFIINYKL